MSIFARFFGRKNPDDRSSKLQANPEITDSLSLQILFDCPLCLDPTALTSAVRSYHKSMKKAICEIDPELADGGNIFGLVGWGSHVIKLVGLDCPMPADPVEQCIVPSHYSQKVKDDARAHVSHLLMYYAGYETDPVEQYVVLTAFAGVLSNFGAIMILNESAQTAFPAQSLSEPPSGEDMMDLLRTMPLLALYCGFVKMGIDGVEGVWMRSFGAHLLNLPDLAYHASSHKEGTETFERMNSILDYMRESGKILADGHTMQLGEDEFFRFRKPASTETFLDGDTPLLVFETIRPDQINKSRKA